MIARRYVRAKCRIPLLPSQEPASRDLMKFVRYATPRRAIRYWLFACCTLVFCMALLGGITRLTESGLSMVDWKPILGTIPPLSYNDWMEKFLAARYTQLRSARLNGSSSRSMAKKYWRKNSPRCSKKYRKRPITGKLRLTVCFVCKRSVM